MRPRRRPSRSTRTRNRDRTRTDAPINRPGRFESRENAVDGADGGFSGASPGSVLPRRARSSRRSAYRPVEQKHRRQAGSIIAAIITAQAATKAASPPSDCPVSIISAMSDAAVWAPDHLGYGVLAAHSVYWVNVVVRFDSDLRRHLSMAACTKLLAAKRSRGSRGLDHRCLPAETISPCRRSSRKNSIVPP